MGGQHWDDSISLFSLVDRGSCEIWKELRFFEILADIFESRQQNLGQDDKCQIKDFKNYWPIWNILFIDISDFYWFILKKIIRRGLYVYVSIVHAHAHIYTHTHTNTHVSS